MIYKIHTNNGERYSIDADNFEQDGSGTRFFVDGVLVATFYCGEVTRVVQESFIESAEVISEDK